LREGRRLRGIFEPEREEIIEEWRKLHNVELKGSVLLTQYCSGDQIEKNGMGGACGMYGGVERRDLYRVSVGKPEGKRQPGRPRRRREDNKMDLEVGFGHGLD
jgi:hypothetical protein